MTMMRAAGLLLAMGLLGLVGCDSERGEECSEDSDCAGALVCLQRGCWRQRRADAICRSKPACQDRGECTWRDDTCIVGDSFDCHQHSGCYRAGKCTAKAGECITASNGDCERSSDCKDYRKCIAKDGICVK